MNEGITTVLAIDDHPLFRKGVGDLIEMEPSLTMIGEAASGEEGLEKAAQLQPDLILLDLNMKGMDGVATLKRLRELEVEARVIMLTVSDNEADVVAALRAGADGYLLKDMEPEDTLEYLRQAAGGKLVISERLTELLAHALRSEGSHPGSAEQAELTERETQILALIAQGLSNKMIARKLDITEGTVKVHVKHLLKKLNLRSRVEAAVWAVNEGRTPS
ncbi:MAG: two-component system response regulator NarL [Gammaproteobacteria bacterium]|nr:two-component system response regulator NarL [Gammaproteobacteria bacterium]MCW8839933.1 two-component system response regulator NarL [Gammaproteobacteria bacterium]MCW8928481.1 two-component system response regulator NarL [Gammaproteobacteria bacterium]MCW8958013.1 two-component system response regulator NarL [Gammaproteobacteria bacterium]MCW8973163.1 two-component system response regulator NarL [Gammaproteobacteria bacterium]